MQKVYINIHTHNTDIASNKLAVINLFADKKTSIPEKGLFSIGLHPWHIKDCNYKEVLATIKSKAKESNIIAVGETGLDRNIETDLETQRSIFIKQALIAEENSIPVIIHCVRYFDEIIQIKKDLNPKSQWIIHGFNNKPYIAEKLLANGFYLSFGKHLLINGSNAENSLKITPTNRIFLENDDSNTPISEIYKKANIIKEENLSRVIFENFNQAFIPIINQNEP